MTIGDEMSHEMMRVLMPLPPKTQKSGTVAATPPSLVKVKSFRSHAHLNNLHNTTPKVMPFPPKSQKSGTAAAATPSLLKLKSIHSHRQTPTHLNNLLNTTAQTKSLKHATQIHSQIITNSFISLPFLFNNLLNLYSKCGRISHSLLLFSTAHQVTKTVVSWTSLICHLSHCAAPFEALSLFSQMRTNGVYPNHFTFSAVLPACASTSILVHGQQMHCLISKHGYEGDVFVGSALVDMYAKCHDMGQAEKVFVALPERNLVSWNSMIVGCLLNSLHDKTLFLFREVIREEFISPDQVSFSSVLSASATIGALEVGKQVHGVVVKQGLLTLSYVKNSLMDMYLKCGLFDEGALLFNSLGIGDRDVIAWNVMSMGCVYNENFEEACNYFWVMRRAGILPDEASYSTALHASAHLATMDQGTLIHNQIIKTGFSRNTCVASSLITMYAKCGSLDDAFRVFEEIENRNVVCWTAMIAACQQHGNGNQVLVLFEKMLADGLKPDYITFVCVISACSHTGRVEEGHAYFNSMAKVHGINPGHEHYACMVDLLGRAGQLDEAKKLIAEMPMKPDSSVWGALLGACANYGNLEMGIEVAGRLFELEPNNPGNYVLLSNMYAHKGKLREADQVRRLMGINRVRKEPGCSWIDVKNKTFVFTVHDKSHARMDEIYEMLKKVEELVKNKGYMPQTQFAVNSAEEFKEQSLWYHSEKIALAFGLLALPADAPIRIKKNLRTCGDCHTVMKFASEIFKREIIVRDINRFHHFRNGLCSCRDYW